MVNYLEIRRLGVQLIFNKNVIKLKDNKKYIEEIINIIVMLPVKWGYNYKNDVLVYFKVSLNQITKIELIKIIKLLHN